MKKNIYFSLAFLSLLGTSCQDNLEQPEVPQSSAVITATGESISATRAAFEHPSGDFFWNPGDKIVVSNYYKKSTSYFTNHIDMTLIEGAGTSTGKFRADDLSQFEEGITYTPVSAFFPGALSEYEYKYNTGNIQTVNFPKVRNITNKDVSGSFPQKDSKFAKSFGLPMFGFVDNGNVSMKHMSAALFFLIDLSYDEKYKLEFKSFDPEYYPQFKTYQTGLYGQFDVTNNETLPEIKTKITGADWVTINLSNFSSGLIAVPIPTGDFEGLAVRLTKIEEGGSEKEMFCRVIPPFTAKRGHLYNIWVPSYLGHLKLDIIPPEYKLYEEAYKDGVIKAIETTNVPAAGGEQKVFFSLDGASLCTQVHTVNGVEIDRVDITEADAPGGFIRTTFDIPANTTGKVQYHRYQFFYNDDYDNRKVYMGEYLFIQKAK